MDIMHGWKPLTEVERAFAAAKAALLKSEILGHQALMPGLLDYSIHHPGIAAVRAQRVRRVVTRNVYRADGLKLCTGCNTVKADTQFYYSEKASNKDRLSSRCRTCSIKYSREYQRARAARHYPNKSLSMA